MKVTKELLTVIRTRFVEKLRALPLPLRMALERSVGASLADIVKVTEEVLVLAEAQLELEATEKKV